MNRGQYGDFHAPLIITPVDGGTVAGKVIRSKN